VYLLQNTGWEGFGEEHPWLIAARNVEDICNRIEDDAGIFRCDGIRMSGRRDEMELVGLCSFFVGYLAALNTDIDEGRWRTGRVSRTATCMRRAMMLEGANGHNLRLSV